MPEYQYILEPYDGMSTRYDCPGCSKRHEFTRYINSVTGAYLAPSVGKCNREISCGYHYTPKQYFQDNGIKKEFIDQYAHPRARAYRSQNLTLPKLISFIPVEHFNSSLLSSDTNYFKQYLNGLFGSEITNQLIIKYCIGNSNIWPGATLFWQIDSKGSIRTGKIMVYSPTTGKRVKEPFNHINWVHSVLKLPEFDLKQCFFGEHLLKIDPLKPVAIVESEKTAGIASIYLPQFIWLACGSLTNLSVEKCKVLSGRKVTLFPDLNGFVKWSQKVQELTRLLPGTRFSISDMLERVATETEKGQGLDLADYLIRFDYREFQQSGKSKPIKNECEQPKSIEPINSELTVIGLETNRSETWEQEITELEHYFKNATLPDGPIILNSYSTLTNFPLFIHSHLEVVKANNGKRAFLPYLNRLQELKQNLANPNLL